MGTGERFLPNMTSGTLRGFVKSQEDSEGRSTDKRQLYGVKTDFRLLKKTTISDAGGLQLGERETDVRVVRQRGE